MQKLVNKNKNISKQPEDELRSLESQFRVLEQVSQAVIGQINLNEVIKIILDQLVKKLDYIFSGLFLLDENRKYLALQQVSVPKTVEKIFKIAVGMGNLLDVKFDLNDSSSKDCYVVKPVLEKSIVSSTHVYDFSIPALIDKKKSFLIEKLTGIKYLVGIPINLKNNVIGSLVVASKNADLGERDKKVLQTFANQISIAIYNSQLFSQVQQQVTTLEEQAKDLNSLYALSTLAGSSLNRSIILQSLIDKMPEKLGHLGVVAGGILLKQSDLDHLLVAAMTKAQFVQKVLKYFKHGPTAQITTIQVIAKSPVLAKVVSDKNLQITNSLFDIFPDYVKKRDDRIMKRFADISSYCIVPIIAEDEIKGFAMYAFNVAPEKIQKRQQDILQVFTNHISTTLENVTLFEELSKQYEKVEHQRKALAVANIKLRELDQNKSEFISIASHQLRTPLTVIKGYVSLILEGAVGECPPQVKEQLDKVAGSTERLVHLVNDLLDVSRIERGAMTFEMVKISLDKIFKAVVDEMGMAAQKKGLKLTLELTKATPKILADERKMHEVMINMVDNAIKYTDQGAVQVSLAQQGKNIVFAVKDTGMGFSSETKYKLFQKFSRSDKSSAVHTEGLGLGLFVAKKIIEAHHGQIYADSQGEGKGSTFGFTVPVDAKK